MQERILDNTYRLLEEIGRGGFGAVYRAVRIGAEGSGPVAIKFLNRGSLPTLHEQMRFQREATLMSQLLHPGTVTVYELGESDGRAYIVMEYVDGQNLRHYVRARGGRLPLHDILEILIQSAEALEYVHGHNIVHRDIKPQNILVANLKDSGESKIQLKIVDFGVARLSDQFKQSNENGMSRAEVVGTFNYMAPESTGLVDWGIDARADIYSLGIVAYELVTGRTPFHEFKNEELLKAHIEKSPPSFLKDDGPQYHDLLERIVMKCIEKRPENRYQSMFGLLSDLKRLLNDVRIHGKVVDDFEIATKDIALSYIFGNIFVGRNELVDQVVNNINFRSQRSRITWGLIRSSVGLGRTRCLTEVRRQLEQLQVPYLHIRFTESEQRLSFRALSLAVNEQLQALEAKAPHIFQSLMQDMAMIAGSSATEVARLIPALRPHLTKVSQSRSLDEVANKEEKNLETSADENNADAINIASFYLEKEQGNKKNQLQVRAPLQQIFLELLRKIASQRGYLVFLLDDIHLADPASIGLFQFVTERVNDQSNFAFVMTIREGIARQNFVLDNFLLRLSNLRRRFHVWDLTPLSQYDFQLFLQAIGLPRPTQKFLEFVTAKCDGSPLLLHALLKQMVEIEALVPERKAFNPWAPVFQLDWTKMSELVVDYRNVEGLLASLDRLDNRDQKLTYIAAVSHEACEFEFFRVEKDFTLVELESRLLSLVRRGIFEILGDENLPVQRRSFVFSHEKLRTAVLSSLEIQNRRRIHLALANRIIALYPKPRREQVLSLAKHFEGAGALADSERSSAIFLKAARLHARSFEHSLAKYYAERAMARASTIGQQQERLIRLREAFETEYMIHIAENELVEASDVCQQLVALTFDSQRKETLQLHWGHLLLGLGRHRMAYNQVLEAIERKVILPFSQSHRFIAKLWERISGFGFFTLGYHLIQFPLFRGKEPTDNQIQGLMIMVLAQAHGADSRTFDLLAAAIRFGLHRRGPTRPVAVFNMLIAAQFLKVGKVDRAFEIAETLERSMESNGRVDVARWVRALRAIWLDYPMGRVERLARVLDERKDSQLPSLGALNTESHALRTWMRCTSPRIWRQKRRSGELTSQTLVDKKVGEKARHVSTGYVSDRARKTRKIDLHKDVQQAKLFGREKIENTFVNKQLDDQALDSQPQSKQLRKLREAGENGQFIGLGVFADVLRYAISDRLDLLRRSVDQFSRQRYGSVDGEIFKNFSSSMQEIALGQYKEALYSYILGIKCLVKRTSHEISLPVSDGIRLGVVALPMLAFSMGARGWPWRKSFYTLLERVDQHLNRAEGYRNPKRTPMTPLFLGIMKYMAGDVHASLKIIGEAKDAAKSSQNDLFCFFAEQALGLACSEFDQVRSMDYFAECYRTAHDLSWKMLERQLLSLCRRLNLPLQHQFPELLAESEKIHFRRRNAGHALNHVIESWLVMSREPQTVGHYIAQSPRVVARILSSPLSFLFSRESEEKGSLQPSARWVDETNLFLQNLSDEAVGLKSLEAELVRNLPRFYDDPVRLVPVKQSGSKPLSQHWSPLQSISQGEFSTGSGTNATQQTPTLANADLEVTRTQKIASEEDRLQADTPYSVYLALKNRDEFFGWLAIGRVLLSQFVSKDVEFDLLLMARHTAFHLACEEKIQKTNSMSKNEKFVLSALEPRILPFPNGVATESIGRLEASENRGHGVFSVGAHRILFLLWSFEANQKQVYSEINGLFTHYTTIFLESLRDMPEPIALDKFALRFSSDVGRLLERAALNHRFERVSINAVLIDVQAREAQECVFGVEQFTFSGTANVERELLFELNGVLRLDRLVYRERRRVLTSNQYAWLMSHDNRMRERLAKFSQVGFLDNYIHQKRSRDLSLAKAFGEGYLFDDFSALVVLVEDPQEHKESAA